MSDRKPNKYISFSEQLFSEDIKPFDMGGDIDSFKDQESPNRGGVSNDVDSDATPRAKSVTFKLDDGSIVHPIDVDDPATRFDLAPQFAGMSCSPSNGVKQEPASSPMQEDNRAQPSQPNGGWQGGSAGTQFQDQIMFDAPVPRTMQDPMYNGSPAPWAMAQNPLPDRYGDARDFLPDAGAPQHSSPAPEPTPTRSSRRLGNHSSPGYLTKSPSRRSRVNRAYRKKTSRSNNKYTTLPSLRPGESDSDITPRPLVFSPTSPLHSVSFATPPAFQFQAPEQPARPAPHHRSPLSFFPIDTSKMLLEAEDPFTINCSSSSAPFTINCGSSSTFGMNNFINPPMDSNFGASPASGVNQQTQPFNMTAMAQQNQQTQPFNMTALAQPLKAVIEKDGIDVLSEYFAWRIARQCFNSPYVNTPRAIFAYHQLELADHLFYNGRWRKMFMINESQIIEYHNPASYIPDEDDIYRTDRRVIFLWSRDQNGFLTWCRVLDGWKIFPAPSMPHPPVEFEGVLNLKKFIRQRIPNVGLPEYARRIAPEFVSDNVDGDEINRTLVGNVRDAPQNASAFTVATMDEVTSSAARFPKLLIPASNPNQELDAGTGPPTQAPGLPPVTAGAVPGTMGDSTLIHTSDTDMTLASPAFTSDVNFSAGSGVVEGRHRTELLTSAAANTNSGFLTNRKYVDPRELTLNSSSSAIVNTPVQANRLGPEVVDELDGTASRAPDVGGNVYDAPVSPDDDAMDLDDNVFEFLDFDGPDKEEVAEKKEGATKKGAPKKAIKKKTISKKKAAPVKKAAATKAAPVKKAAPKKPAPKKPAPKKKPASKKPAPDKEVPENTTTASDPVTPAPGVNPPSDDEFVRTDPRAALEDPFVLPSGSKTGKVTKMMYMLRSRKT